MHNWLQHKMKSKTKKCEVITYPWFAAMYSGSWNEYAQHDMCLPGLIYPINTLSLLHPSALPPPDVEPKIQPCILTWTHVHVTGRKKEVPTWIEIQHTRYTQTQTVLFLCYGWPVTPGENVSRGRRGDKEVKPEKRNRRVMREATRQDRVVLLQLARLRDPKCSAPKTDLINWAAQCL